jgi:hypothetical protein
MPNKKLEHINYNGTTYDLGVTELATTTAPGLMSASDKEKLDSISGGSGSVVVANTLSQGELVATIGINGVDHDINVPTYTGNAPITVSGKTISHNTSGVSAKTYGTTASTSENIDFGDSFTVPGFAVNTTGHITSAGSHSIALPTLSVTPARTTGEKIATINVNGTDKDIYATAVSDTYTATSTAAMSGKAVASALTAYTKTSSLAKVATSGSYEDLADKPWIPAATDLGNKVAYTATTTTGDPIGEINIDGTGYDLYSPAYTGTGAITVSNHQIKHATGGANVSAGETTNKNLGFGDSFKVLRETVNSYGHTTSLTSYSMVLPTASAVATYTTSANGNIKIGTVNLNGTDTDYYIPKYPTASDLGLSKALKFIGFATSTVTDGQTTVPTVSGVSSYTPAVGDVIISSDSHNEFVYTSANKWELLGGDGDYITSVAVDNKNATLA